MGCPVLAVGPHDRVGASHGPAAPKPAADDSITVREPAMRIGIDMIGLQSPANRGRGIGRYTKHLLESLLAANREDQYVLMYHAGLPVQHDFPATPCTTPVILERDPDKGDRTPGDRLERALHTNEYALDLFLETSPLEMPHHEGYRLPATPLGGPRMVAVLFDLIRYLYPEEYLQDMRFSDTYYESVRKLQQYDGLLAISHATRRDCLRILGVPDVRVVYLGCASDPDFAPSSPGQVTDLQQSLRSRLGIERPYVLNVGGDDMRKNLEGLVTAFGLLPAPLRQQYQLVITCSLSTAREAQLRACAQVAGVAESLILTNGVADEVLRVLYQGCTAFVFPSVYEGFGLPILEAMSCGAPVIAGNNSSQVEVVGQAGLLVNAGDPVDIAAKLHAVLQDPGLARALRQRSLEQSKTFAWPDIARRAQEAFQRIVRGQPRWTLLRRPGSVRATSGVRQRIAFVASMPPQVSDMADLSSALVDELASRYAIDLYHEGSCAPFVAYRSPAIRTFDYRLYRANANLLDYRTTLYQIGDTPVPAGLNELLLEHPGIVTLHRPFDWRTMDTRFLEKARTLIVHDASWQAEILAHCPPCAHRVVLIPLGPCMPDRTPVERRTLRSWFGISDSAMVVAAMGSSQPQDALSEVLNTFAAFAQVVEKVEFVLVGRQLHMECLTAEARRLGFGWRMHFLSYRSGADLCRLARIADIGLALCRPGNLEHVGWLPTLGAAGVATLAPTDGGWIPYPESVGRAAGSGGHRTETLSTLLYELLEDALRRQQLGEATKACADQFEEWPQIAAVYADLIADCGTAFSSRRRKAA
jgi:glycosyltransferase involved in cell wall biosynthesis